MEQKSSSTLKISRFISPASALLSQNFIRHLKYECIVFIMKLMDFLSIQLKTLEEVGCSV